MSIRNKLFILAQSIFSPPRPKICAQISNYSYGKVLREKLVVVIGGTKGIGKAIACKCIDEGATVIVTGRDELALDSLKSEFGNAIITKIFDSCRIDEIDAFVNSIISTYGKLDALVLNAGISLHEGDFRNVSIEGFDKQINTNLKSYYFFSKSYLGALLNHNITGNLLFLSSETSAKSNDLPYGLTKVAINSLVGGLSRRVVEKGIRVNAIAPGLTLTEMTSKKSSFLDDISNNSPQRRFILPVEIANVALFLLSDASSCITGEVLFCDAGSHLKINGMESDYSIK